MALPVGIYVTRSFVTSLQEYSAFRIFHNRSNQFYSVVFNDFKKYSSSYKAAILKEPNKTIEIEDVKPVPLKKNQVRIATRACALNASDLLMCQGLSRVQPKLPFIPGYEIAGEVLEINIDTKADKSKDKKKDDHKNHEDEDDESIPITVGDRVIALSRERLGGFSEQCIVDYKDIWRLPASLDFKTAVGLADTYALALLGLFRRAQIQKCDVVLVTAGPGGLGSAAVDIAANVYKSKVIAVCNTEACAQQLRDKGAWSAITYSDKKLRNKVMEISGKHGADIVFETIGGDIFESAIHSVAPEGKVIIGGFASQRIPDLPMSELLLLPSFSLIGVSLRNYREFALKVYRQIMSDTLQLYEHGLVTPLISKTFTLDQVNDALLHVKSTDSVGKIVLLMNIKK